MKSAAVIALLAEIAERLGSDVVQLRRASPVPGVLTLELIPANPASAPVGIRIAEAGETDAIVSLGGTAFEIPAEGADYSNGSGLDDIRDLIGAAIAGRFLERVWVRHATEIRRDGVCQISGREIKVSHVSPSWFIPRRGKTNEIRFDPYS